MSESMDRYLSSSEVLLRLPETQPPHHVKGGLKNLGNGIVGTAAGVGGGPYGFYYLMQNYDFNWGAAVLYIGSVLLTLGGTWYGLRKLADGTTSFFDPMLEHARDGSIYFRNGGYIGNRSRFDRRFGSVIHPIDELTKLNEIRDGKWFLKSDEFLVNGAILKSRRFEKEIDEEYVRDGRKRTRTKKVPVDRQEIIDDPLPMDYMAFVTVEFDGTEFRARTGKGSLVKYLAGRPAHSALRLRGRYDIGNGRDRFDIKEVGEALITT